MGTAQQTNTLWSTDVWSSYASYIAAWPWDASKSTSLRPALPLSPSTKAVQRVVYRGRIGVKLGAVAAPEDEEVRCSLHGRNLAHSFLGIGGW